MIFCFRVILPFAFQGKLLKAMGMALLNLLQPGIGVCW